ncbi:MAG: DNA alkylation repair protein [Terriglobales bacterium]
MKDPAYIADHIRRVLKDGGSAPHSQEVQRFFKEEVKSRGWYTAELRKVARRFRRALVNEHGVEYLVKVADQLFQGDVLEEKVFAVMLLEKNTADFTDRDFRLFASWLDRASSWADHDALVNYVIGPMVAADLSRTVPIYRWAKSKNRWRRRAAAVALIRPMRDANSGKRAFPHVKRITEALLSDGDDMVRKGLGWLLRESAKADARMTIPLLLSIRDTAPRLVLRTACETLPPATKKRVLAK